MQVVSQDHIENDMQKYEGAEKLLEVWFFEDSDMRTSQPSRSPDLRKLTREQIEHLLQLARCEIVSEYHSQHQLSFVLSESSLFITNHRIILKTCGQTRILQTLKPLIQYAFRMGFKKYTLYYSRRSFLFPELQVSPHHDFRAEVENLGTLCKEGSGYTYGPVNGDSWNFYWGQSTSEQLKEPPGQTLELMMRDMNPARMEAFYKCTSRSAEEATVRSGIANIFPHAKICSFLFEPCGYSANGLMHGDEYFTIHVTPEPEFSYASFETNLAIDDYPAFIAKVLAIFEPDSFLVSFFADSGSPTFKSHSSFEEAWQLSQRYRRHELHTSVIACGRKLTVAEYFSIDHHRVDDEEEEELGDKSEDCTTSISSLE